MPVVRMSSKGQIVIPREIRRKLGLKAGTNFHVRVEGHDVVLFRLPDDPIRALRGSVKGGPSLTKSLLDDRKEDLRREEKKFARFLRRPRLDSR